MATIKSYTTLEQSKKLAEILPTESADAFYIVGKKPVDIVPIYGSVTHQHLIEQMAYKRAISCWSLAALLEVIPDGLVNRMSGNSHKWEAASWNGIDFDQIHSVEGFDNPVDACYELILKLHELNLL